MDCSLGNGYQRKSKTVAGPQAYIYGLIARQPNSNWQSRMLSVQQRMNVESSKDNEQKMKDNQREIIKSKFHRNTDKKNYDSKIRNIVKERLQAADQLLDAKRERLRDLLLSEEQAYIREYVTEAQKVSENVYEEQKRKALECKVRHEAEDAALASEKRLQQYMSRCEELRTFRESLNTKEVAKAVAKQMEDNQRRRESEIELEKVWQDVALKNYALMVAYEEEEERKRKMKTQEMHNILQNQIKGRKVYEEESERMKAEERANMDKLREELIYEAELERREIEKKKKALKEEMEEIQRNTAELREKRRTQEKVLNDMFNMLIEQEIKREKELVQDNKTLLRKESELFKAYLEETALKRKKAEEKADELRRREIAKIEEAQHQEEVKKCEAVLKLKEEVLKERECQIKSKEKRKEEGKRKEVEENTFAELLRLESLQVDKENKQRVEKQQKEYRMDLAKQIEYNKQQLLKECEEEERQTREMILKEESYFNKVKDLIANQCTASAHPFLKKMQGMV